MSDYSGTHSRALSLVTRKGAAVTFTREDAEQTDSTGAVTYSTSTVTGYAVRFEGSPERYERLSLVESESPTLLFCPDTFDTCPQAGDSVTWAGNRFVVRDVEAIAPNGDVIAASVVISR